MNPPQKIMISLTILQASMQLKNNLQIKEKIKENRFYAQRTQINKQERYKWGK